jgi:hypothetical protein
MVDCAGLLYRVGAKDQYTPNNALPVSYGWLYALKNQIAADRQRIELTDRELRKLLAETYLWVGEQELRSPQGRWSPGHVWKSLWLNPLQRRLLFLLPFSLVPRRCFRLVAGLKRWARQLISGQKAS